MTYKTTEELKSLRDFLHDHLLTAVIPFWLRHAIDPAGGINSCLRDDGTLINRDKWLWSQWRSVWVFSKLYNQIEKNEQWLKVAQNICDFTSRYGWDDQAGGWCLRLSGEGEVLDGYESIYSDAFAIYGLTELAKASGRQEPIALARKTAESVLPKLKLPHDQIPHHPYPVPAGARVHGIAMMFSLVLWEFGQFVGEQKYLDIAGEQVADLFDNFYRADRDVVLERIAQDNSEYPAPLGTAIVPGHVIEDMWFQIHIAREQNNQRRIKECCRLIRRHLELGWDRQYGGLLLAVDADNGPEIGWENADTKVWWPHTEVLYALLLAWECTKEDWCLDWYEKVHEYSFSHFPVAEHGEWTHYLNRQNVRLDEPLFSPIKDPFHLPRALIYCIEVLDRLTG